ncbi:DUF4062 domain-containing protein [Vibrio cholerae]|nr:DUF4062 domain-containing protein [Vibrio cholerae]EJL6467424.1 DUF4062 domain-containing protein [Vibrio cholerae]EJL6909158.1 DUF4062 domain-containing protein [Vibrio cholerae]ELT6289825.1 DUF4062 domain-containing protein [Vibrio cholerae]ELU8559861.1 DUF4062 domain-containing protein [Vibrio cholerae]
MAKPRIFVSSTYYDLKHIRNSLEAFIDSFGYESVLYEDGDIPFHHDSPLDISCYSEIKNCHILVLIIGGRYGSPASEPSDENERIEFYNSVTKKEYETARAQDIPIYVFIDKNVHSEYHTFKKNRNVNGIEYAHVDNVNIFKLIDEIYSQKRNNLIKEFEKFDDIACWLKDQWAGLFADFLSNRNRERDLDDLSTQVTSLKELSSILKSYSETIMEKVDPENFQKIIAESNKSLRKRFISIFERHEMVRYLKDNSPQGIGISSLYDAFQKANTVEEMLSSCNFEPNFIQEMVKNTPAHNDFERLKSELG